MATVRSFLSSVFVFCLASFALGEGTTFTKSAVDPAVEFAANGSVSLQKDTKTLGEAIVEVSNAGGIYFMMRADLPIWKSECKLGGQVSLAAFFSKTSQQFGYHIYKYAGENLYVFEDAASVEQSLKGYELKGRLYNQITSQNDEASIKTKIIPVLLGKKSANQPVPKVFIEPFNRLLIVVATPDQHSRLAEYLSTEDRPSKQWQLVIRNSSGQVLLSSVLNEDSPVLSSRFVDKKIGSEVLLTPNVVLLGGEERVNLTGTFLYNGVVSERSTVNVVLDKENSGVIVDSKKRQFSIVLIPIK